MLQLTEIHQSCFNALRFSISLEAALAYVAACKAVSCLAPPQPVDLMGR